MPTQDACTCQFGFVPSPSINMPAFVVALDRNLRKIRRHLRNSKLGRGKMWRDRQDDAWCFHLAVLKWNPVVFSFSVDLIFRICFRQSSGSLVAALNLIAFNWKQESHWILIHSMIATIGIITQPLSVLAVQYEWWYYDSLWYVLKMQCVWRVFDCWCFSRKRSAEIQSPRRSIAPVPALFG